MTHSPATLTAVRLALFDAAIGTGDHAADFLDALADHGLTVVSDADDSGLHLLLAARIDALRAMPPGDAVNDAVLLALSDPQRGAG